MQRYNNASTIGNTEAAYTIHGFLQPGIFNINDLYANKNDTSGWPTILLNENYVKDSLILYLDFAKLGNYNKLNPKGRFINDLANYTNLSIFTATSAAFLNQSVSLSADYVSYPSLKYTPGTTNYLSAYCVTPVPNSSTVTSNGVGTASAVSSTDYTVSFWINLSSFSYYPTIKPRGGNITISFDSSTGGANIAMSYIDYTSHTYNGIIYMGGYTGGWINYIIVFRDYEFPNLNGLASNAFYYVNGTLVNSSLDGNLSNYYIYNKNKTVAPNTDAFSNSYITTTNFAGSIGMLQVYNRSLSASEVIQNYNAFCYRYGLSANPLSAVGGQFTSSNPPSYSNSSFYDFNEFWFYSSNSITVTKPGWFTILSQGGGGGGGGYGGGGGAGGDLTISNVYLLSGTYGVVIGGGGGGGGGYGGQGGDTYLTSGGSPIYSHSYSYGGGGGGGYGGGGGSVTSMYSQDFTQPVYSYMGKNNNNSVGGNGSSGTSTDNVTWYAGGGGGGQDYGGGGNGASVSLDSYGNFLYSYGGGGGAGAVSKIIPSGTNYSYHMTSIFGTSWNCGGGGSGGSYNNTNNNSGSYGPDSSRGGQALLADGTTDSNTGCGGGGKGGALDVGTHNGSNGFRNTGGGGGGGADGNGGNGGSGFLMICQMIPNNIRSTNIYYPPYFNGPGTGGGSTTVNNW